MKLEQLTSVLDFQGGSQPPKKDFEPQPSKSNIRFLQIRDFKTDDKIVYIPVSKKNRLCKKEDILIARYGASVGQILSGKEGAYNVALMKVIDKNELFKTKYLYYFFNSQYFQKNLLSRSERSAQAGFNKGDLSEIKIPVPSLQEQEKIVERLDKIFIRTNNYKSEIDKTIYNSKKLFKSILDQEFSPLNQKDSQLKKLSDLSEIKGGKRVPKGYKLLDKKTNFPYIRVTDFDGEGGIDESNLKFIDENIYNQIKNYTINSNNLFISIAGTIGKSGIVPSNLDGANLTENACKLVFNENVHNRFIYFFTKSNFFKKQVVEKTKIAGQPKLSLSRLGEILIQIPTLEKQLELTNKFYEIEKNINSLINKKNILTSKTDLLKKSILNKEFSYE